MSILYVKRKQGDWSPRYLAVDGCADELELASVADAMPVAPSWAAAVAIRRVTKLPRETWALITSPQAQVRLNGMAVLLGLVVLADRDEIVVTDAISPQGRRFYFSSQSVVRVEAAPAGLLSCPRCKLPIDAQSPAVRCPRCRVWHHQLADRECWTYADRCAACHDQDTSLSGELRWTPEEM